MKAFVSAVALAATMSACGTNNTNNTNDSSLQQYQTHFAVHCPGKLALALKEHAYEVTFQGKQYLAGIDRTSNTDNFLYTWTFRYNNPQPRRLIVQQVEVENAGAVPYKVSIQTGPSTFEDLGKCWVSYELLNATF